MTIETTRRAVLVGAPAIALVATIPGTLKAAPADNAVWEKVKADYSAATDRYNKACLAEDRAMLAQRTVLDRWPAPERKITYTDAGWSIVNDRAHVELKPSEETLTLTPRSYEDVPGYTKETPEWLGYRDEVEAWEAKVATSTEDRAFEAAKQDWHDACDAQITAWNALVACPVISLAHVVEKIEIGHPMAKDSPEDLALLMTGVEADLKRITTH
jgi:hypothetical protein